MVRGMSGLSYRAGLSDRLKDTWESQDEWKKKLLKRGAFGAGAGKLGGTLLKKFGQKGLSSLMKKGLSLAFKGAAASNPWLKGASILAPIIAGSVLKGVGNRGASKIYSMFDKTAKNKIKPTSDLQTSSWENLDKFREGIGQKERGAAYGAAAGDFVSGLKGEAAGKLSDLALGSQFGQSLQSKFQDYMNPGERESFKQSFGGDSSILNMTGEKPHLGSSITSGGFNPLEHMQDQTSFENLGSEQGLAMRDALQGGAYSGFGLSNPNFSAIQGTDAQDWGQQLLAGAFSGGMQSGGSALQRRSLMPGRNLSIGRDFESSLQDAKMRNAMPKKGILSKLLGRKQDPRESFSSSLEEFPSVLAEVRNEPNTDFQDSSDTNISDILKTIMSPSFDNLNLNSPEYMETRGYQPGGIIEGASPYSAKMTPEGEFQQIMSVPASEVGEGEGLRYYLGESVKSQPTLARRTAQHRAMVKMATAPQDSIPASMIDNYFSEEEPQSEKRGWRDLLGMQMGGMAPGGVSNALPYNMGGPVMQYNVGGSIGQQPLSYQLGGLLKYKRSPMAR
jgi:hypothetical protein